MPDKPKKTLSPEHLEKMRLGRERAKARRQAEKAANSQALSKPVTKNTPSPNVEDAKKYQRELLDNYKQNKAREQELKARFDQIKAETFGKTQGEELAPEPELNLDEELEPELNLDEELEPEPEIIQPKPEPEPELDEYAEYQARVARIAGNLRNDEARQMFNQICGTYDRSKTLEQNLTELIDDVDERLKKQANALQAKRDAVEEQKERERVEAKRVRIAKQRKIRAAMMRMSS